jgi:hypothetical protein
LRTGTNGVPKKKHAPDRGTDCRSRKTWQLRDRRVTRRNESSVPGRWQFASVDARYHNRIEDLVGIFLETNQTRAVATRIHSGVEVERSLDAGQWFDHAILQPT